MTDEKKVNLDQGFNDSELEDIMNEIESLEKDFDMAEPEKTAVDPIAEELGDVGEPVEQAEPVMAEEPVEEAEPVMAEEPVEEAEPVMAEEPAVEELSSEVSSETNELLDEAPVDSTNSELEKAFVEEFDADNDATNDTSKMDLQEVIDQEVDNLLNNREEDVAHADSAPKEDNVVEMSAPVEVVAEPKASTPAETKMSFSMSGNAAISLDFEFSGQKVSLYVNEDEGFIIQMDSGAKFSIPVVDKAYKKAS